MIDQTDRVRSLLTAHRFVWVNELSLHLSIAELLTGEGILFDREVRLSTHERIDFLTRAGLGIEVKVDGSPAMVERQLRRYQQSDRVSSLMLVTTKPRHQLIRIDGVTVVWIGGSM